MTLILVALAIVVVFAAGWSVGRSRQSHHDELTSRDQVARGVSVSDVLRWNRLQDQARIHPGDRLRIADARLSAELAYVTRECA